MEDISDLEWDVVCAIWGQKARVPAPSISAGMNPQRIDANAAHVIKDRVMAAIKDHVNSERALLWDEGFSEGMRQWQTQREDPTHPITRTNPYQEN